MPDHLFGGTTAVGVSEAKSDYDYNYNTGFQNWKENKEVECQSISLCRPPLNSTIIGTNTSYGKLSLLESGPVGTKNPDPQTLTLQKTLWTEHREKL